MDELLQTYAKRHMPSDSHFSTMTRAAPALRSDSRNLAILIQQLHQSSLPVLATLERPRLPPRIIQPKPPPDMLAPFFAQSTRTKPFGGSSSLSSSSWAMSRASSDGSLVSSSRNFSWQPRDKGAYLLIDPVSYRPGRRPNTMHGKSRAIASLYARTPPPFN